MLRSWVGSEASYDNGVLGFDPPQIGDRVFFSTDPPQLPHPDPSALAFPCQKRRLN